MEPKIVKIKAGWAARGDGWAVHADTPEAALEAFKQAEQKHQEIMQREDLLAVDDDAGRTKVEAS